MKEDESIFDQFRKEQESRGNRWQHLAVRDELHKGLKELSYELRGVSQQTVSLLSDMITLIPVAHADVLVETRPGGYIVNIRASVDEVKKQSLPGEEAYAMRSVVAARIARDFSDLLVFSDTETADPTNDSLASRLANLIMQLRGDRQAMKETTDMVMRVVLGSIGDWSEETDKRDNSLTDFIEGLDLEGL